MVRMMYSATLGSCAWVQSANLRKARFLFASGLIDYHSRDCRRDDSVGLVYYHTPRISAFQTFHGELSESYCLNLLSDLVPNDGG